MHLCLPNAYFLLNPPKKKEANKWKIVEDSALNRRIFPDTLINITGPAKGHDLLKRYQYHTTVAKHYFCSNCGIYTHHKMRSNPNMYGINVACLEGVKPFELENVGVNDGINHPLDKKK